MDEFLEALRAFWQHLAAVHWSALAIAAGFHVLRLTLRTRAWRNIIAAAYPGLRVRWRGVLGGYFAGIGVNSIAPARSGDLVKLYLVRHRIEGSTYPTLAATLFPETLFDLVVGSGLLVWAITLGALPSLDVLPSLPSIDWGWPFRHPRLALVIGGVLLVALVVAVVWAMRRVREFKRRVTQGFAVLGDRRRYLRHVVTWQAAAWICRLATLYFGLKAFGLAANVHDTLLVQVAQSLSTLLPLTPGGAGTEQGLLIYLFRGKLSTAALLSFSVGLHIAMVTLNVVIGFGAIFLMTRSFRWRRLATKEPEPPAYVREP